MSDWSIPFETSEDSGVVLRPSEQWNKDEAARKERRDNPPFEEMPAIHFYAKILGKTLAIADNPKNSVGDRLIALETCRKIMLDIRDINTGE